MTITKEEVLKLLDRMTFEVVNGELDRGLAEEIGKVLVAESARADQAEAATAAVAERAASESETRHQLHLEQVRRGDVYAVIRRTHEPGKDGNNG